MLCLSEAELKCWTCYTRDTLSVNTDNCNKTLCTGKAISACYKWQVRFFNRHTSLHVIVTHVISTHVICKTRDNSTRNSNTRDNITRDADNIARDNNTRANDARAHISY